MTVCRMCEGTGFMTIPMNSDAGIATKRCKNCNGTGVIIIDTPFSGESEQFPDKEIFRMGTEKFDEVFEDEIYDYTTVDEGDHVAFKSRDCEDDEWTFDELIKKYFGLDYPVYEVKVKISCKPGKIIIQRLEK